MELAINLKKGELGHVSQQAGHEILGHVQLLAIKKSPCFQYTYFG